MFAWCEGLKFSDAIELDDHRPADPQEAVGRELFLQGSQSFAHDVALLAGVEHNVVSGGFAPVDRAGADKGHAFALSDRDAGEVLFRAFGRAGFEQGEKAVLQRVGGTFASARRRA